MINNSEKVKRTGHAETGGKEQIIEQKLIISYFIKYKNYQRHIREGQIGHAMKLVESSAKIINKKKQNDPKRFIKTEHAAKDGEVAEQSVTSMDPYSQTRKNTMASMLFVRILMKVLAVFSEQTSADGRLKNTSG